MRPQERADLVLRDPRIGIIGLQPSPIRSGVFLLEFVQDRAGEDRRVADDRGVEQPPGDSGLIRFTSELVQPVERQNPYRETRRGSCVGMIDQDLLQGVGVVLGSQ